MSVPPLCRYCGKPLRKRTTIHYVRQTQDAQGWTKDDLVGVFRSKADLQRVTNQQITSLKYHETAGSWGAAGCVWSYTTWDGESFESAYGAGFFCTQTCAVHFANLHAKEGRATSTYVAALVRQRELLKIK